MKFEGKVAVITGGSGVLCSAMAKALAKEGYRVAILGSRQEKVDLVVEEITKNGGIAFGYACDILDKGALIKGKEEIHKHLGPCDLLINGAGGNHPKGTTSQEMHDSKQPETEQTFFDLDQNGIEYVFGINFVGTFLATQVFAEDMTIKQKGIILNISSMSAFTPLTKIPAYSAAKSAISNFTQWLAVHFAKTGIRVNAIAPGFFLTEQNHHLLINEQGEYTERSNKIINHTPLGRFGKPEELIGAVLWLADEEASSFVNGIVLPIDGGFSAYSGV